MKKEKRNILIISLLTILIVIIGVAYAAFSYQGIGLDNSELVTGDIYMYYNETSKTININNLMPTEEYSTNDYFEFQVSGKNTYNKKDIYYEIVLSQGEYEGSDLNRTIPIDSQLLKFKLVEVNGDLETEIFSDRTYSDITNKRIWVDTIRSDDRDYSKTYRLYVRIAEYTNICGGEVTDGCDYYINPSEEYANLDWNKLYASIKVNVKGDLEEKSIETDASCFGYDIEYEGVSYTKTTEVSYDLNSNLTEEQLDICASHILQSTGIEPGSYDKQTDENYLLMKSLCNGETIQGFTFKTYMALMEKYGMTINYTYLEEEKVISNYQVTEKYINSDTNAELDINSIDKNELGLVLTSYNQVCGVDVVVPKYINGVEVKSLTGEKNSPLIPGLKNIILPNSVLSIGRYTFRGNNLRNITIPNSVTVIEDSAFQDNQLTSVEIPNSVIYLAGFNGNKITNITIPDSVTTIGVNAFKDNQLTSVEIPNNVTDIGYYSFMGNKITNLEISNSVTTIGNRAFYNNQLTSVVLPDSVTKIDAFAFASNQLVNVQLPNNIKKIAQSVFMGNKLTSIVIPASVITIDASAFSSNQLITVEIPNSVVTIGDNAFAGNQLINVEIPNSVTTIGWYAFLGNQLERVTIGSGIRYMGWSAFEKSSSSNPNLESIVFTSKICDDIKNLPDPTNNATKYFPWLDDKIPYYQEGYKANVIGTDGECEY